MKLCTARIQHAGRGICMYHIQPCPKLLAMQLITNGASFRYDHLPHCIHSYTRYYSCMAKQLCQCSLSALPLGSYVPFWSCQNRYALPLNSTQNLMLWSIHAHSMFTAAHFGIPEVQRLLLNAFSHIKFQCPCGVAIATYVYTQVSSLSPTSLPSSSKGVNVWRDSQSPVQILYDRVRRHGLPEPEWEPTLTVQDKTYRIEGDSSNWCPFCLHN